MCCIALAIILGLPAADVQRLAVLNLRNKAGKRIEAVYFTDQIREAALPIARRVGLQVISRENLLDLLSSSGKTPESCEGECEVETGRRIGADLIVSGEIVRVGSLLKASLRLHDTRSGELLAAVTASGTGPEQLDADLPAKVRALLAALADEPPPPAPPPPAATAVNVAWSPVPGLARDIAIGPRGDVYILGQDRSGGGFNIYRRSGPSWDKIYGAGVRIAAGPDGAWVVNDQGMIYRRESDKWARLEGEASDLALGAGGSAWMVGGQGSGIFRRDGGAWTRIEGAAARIAVNQRGVPWIVNAQHQIFRRDSSSWVQLPGAATAIAAGADGSVWMVGTDPEIDGHPIYRWGGAGWQKAPGSAVSIAVDPDGSPWVVDARGQIFAGRVR